jgi:hypothetical protein
MKNKVLGNIVAVIFVSSTVLAACGGGSDFDGTINTPLAGGQGNGSGNPTPSSPISSTDLTDEEVAGLLFMREEEELARDLYLDIYDAKDGRLNTFKNISDNAETKHAEAIRVLLETYGIDDPSTGSRNTYTDDDLQNLYNQLLNIAVGSDDLAALRVGALVEETDIRDINTHKSHVSIEHQDIISTYDNLLCGSRNHLRAFVKQITNITGQPYVTQVPSLDAEVTAILSSDNERCGR